MVQGLSGRLTATVNASLWVAASLGSGTSISVDLHDRRPGRRARHRHSWALAVIAGLVLVSVVALYGLATLARI